MDLSGLLTAAGLLTALPTLVGVLIAYSIVATILGAFLWISRSVPDNVGVAVTASGITIGGLVVLVIALLNVV